ncbi:MAG TPA: NAD(P)H-dependent oxidoreductase [Rhizobium sp.]
MTKLLYLEASPRGHNAKSIHMAEAYLVALSEDNPDLEIDTIKIWDMDLPEFDGNKIAAKLNVIGGQNHNADQKTAWDQIVEIAGRFIAADRYLFSIPMWNGGIPYRLKHYIDVIHQPGLLWGLDPTIGYDGLLKDKHATLILTSGAYAPSLPSPAFGVDHHSTYMRDWLNQAGVTNIDEVRFQPTLLTPEPACELERAKQAAADLARRHGRL